MTTPDTVRHRIAEKLWVSGQVQPVDLVSLAAAGFRSIVNARPDGEAADQPSAAAIEKAARDAGLACCHVPVVPGHYGDESIAAFADALATLPAPVLGFCRSGTRVASLWALSEARHGEIDSLVRKAALAGFDIAALRPQLAAIAATAEGGA